MENMEKMSGFWENRRVLVTGATGFIGSWLVKNLLSQGAYVVAFVRDADPQSELFRSGDILRVTVVNGTLEDFWALERAINEHDVETIFHFAAQTIVGKAHRSPLPTFEANIRGTYNLLEACRLHQDTVSRVVIASSDKAYGEQTKLPYSEDMPLNGRHPYDVSKSCVDLIAQAYHHTYRLPVVLARCGNVYGGGDLNWSRIVPGTVRSFFQGDRPNIRTDGTYIRDYIYVKDVVMAYIRLAESVENELVQGEAFNFSNEVPLTVLEIVRAIQRLMGCLHIEPIIMNCAKGEIHNQQLCAAKARANLGWQAQFDLERGLRETIAWYEEFFHKYSET
jgi:CDP-glucose 4,6-dehydratase